MWEKESVWIFRNRWYNFDVDVRFIPSGHLSLPCVFDTGKRIWPPECSSGGGLGGPDEPRALGLRGNWGGHSLIHMFPEKWEKNINDFKVETQPFRLKNWPIDRNAQMYLWADGTFLGDDSRPLWLGAQIHGQLIRGGLTLQDLINLFANLGTVSWWRTRGHIDV